MARAAVEPSFDDYVAARGAHLLRVAWLLAGGPGRARELVELALGQALRHWRRVGEQDDGLYDAYVRRALVATFLARRSGRRDAPPEERPDDETDLQREVQAALATLGSGQRAVAVLRYYEDLGERQIADLLDWSVKTVHTLSAVDDRGLDLRTAMGEAVPESPATDGLAEQARRYAARAHRVRAAGVAGLVAVLAVGGAVASGAFRDRVVAPALAAQLSCSMDSPDLPPAAVSGARPLSQDVRAVLVCADRSDASIWVGSLPPDEPLSTPAGLDYLRFDSRDQPEACPPLPSGAAYRMLVLGRDGHVTVHDNQRLACNGWPALDRYFIALGDQLSAQWASPAQDPFLPCPSDLGETFAQMRPTAPALPKGTVLTQVTACFHPLPDPSVLPQAVLPVIRSVLGVGQVAELNADLARAGSMVTPDDHVPCAPLGRGRVVLHARTSDGRLVSLASLCGNATDAAVNWNLDDRVAWSPASGLMLLVALGR